jgi:hypothetical protein
MATVGIAHSAPRRYSIAASRLMGPSSQVARSRGSCAAIHALSTARVAEPRLSAGLV